MAGEKTTATGGPSRSFTPTLWTVVLTAKDLQSPRRKAALQTLVESYWKPLYSFVRRRGNDPETSKDLTQGFFTALIEKNYLQYVDKDKGRFRTFLLMAIQHYLSDDYDRSTAKKRGGGATPLSLEFGAAEEGGLLNRAPSLPPEQLFQREWAVEVLAQAMRALRAEYETSGRLAEFETLRQNLGYGASAGPSYGDLARTLGLSESDIRNRIHRARVRYREAVLDVIRAYTDDEAGIQEELRDLLTSFSS
ncbi:MAG TPA: sigma-70 family RNA polymerase sigma factor [Planctomycetota bacterium]|nr:sigma-70 family RNA polymerase sigma factor [Planctomycetota bacterium]